MRAGLGALVVCCFAFTVGVGAESSEEARRGIRADVRGVTPELSAVCPLADPGDQKAFDNCRQALFRGSSLRRRVSTVLLWGRPHPEPGKSLKDTTLTQFAPEVWTGLYAPL